MFRDYLSLLKQQPAFLLFGLLAACLSSFGQTFYIGLFSGEIRGEFQLSHGEFGLLYSLATLGSGVILLWLGRLVDHFDLRWMTGMTLAGLAMACLAMAIVTHPWLLVLVFFLLRLLGQGMMGHIAITAMGRYFSAARGRAVSIAASGFPLGEAVFPILAVALIATVGWRMSWAIAGIALLILGIPLLLALLRGQDRRHRLWQLRQRRQHQADRFRTNQDWALSDVLKDPRFWLLMPAILSPAFLVTGFFFHQVALAESKDWALSLLAGSFVAFAACQLGGLALAGFLSDRHNAASLLPYYLLPLALAMGIIWQVQAPVWIPVYMGLMGLAAGASGTIVGVLWAELYGTLHLGSIRSVYTALMVFSTAVSPWLLGQLMDLNVSLEDIALTSLAWIIIISIMMALLRPSLKGVNHEQNS
ncbi:MFS family permease [Natronospira proteinivora]|uniref:MFS family permease n=1 Tax=Natronospira proteinivora TaxID=1807133 RepID=A0ABT1G7N3_9GAMM|nr:MFS transporter [Natronospira proteinivora]MCP1727305.1 MFS family permease [Natronospira proteinivora]